MADERVGDGVYVMIGNVMRGNVMRECVGIEMRGCVV